MLGRDYNFRWVVRERLLRQNYFNEDMLGVKNILRRGTSDPKASKQEFVYIPEKAKAGGAAWLEQNECGEEQDTSWNLVAGEGEKGIQAEKGV